ncbi:MAG TPA: T9SS type A sorting domain-containing protein [Bacteroidia bacterium]|jgi:hypothetical protein|nr:T9SS type A sorting domain-containing protein [Bacteroidia bacterium]
MKKISLLAGIFLLNISFAQQQIPLKITYSKCTSFSITKPLSEMQANDEVFEEAKKDSEKKEIKQHRVYHAPVNKKAITVGEDPGRQNFMGNKAMSGPMANWQGQSGSGYPPDPTGAAGPNHYVQAVNTVYKSYTKTGGAVTGGGPFNLSTLWSGSTDDGDPVVLYDKYADRWVITQFNGADKILVAVSTSPNPTGSYYAYTFIPQAGVFPDYPKYSVWTDGYYCTSNIGTPGNMAVFDRTKMIAGNPTAGMITANYPSVPNNGFFCPLSADADGQLPPNGTPCPLFSYEDDTWATGAVDQLRIYNFNTDWITPANTTLTLDTLLPTTPINVNFTSTWDDVPQPGSSQKLDALSGVLTFRAPYRVWTGYNSVVICHSVIVNTSTNQVGVRWYELRQDAITKKWSIYQQSTYAPDSDSRWVGSIAMDDNGSVGLAYSVSSTVTPVSLRYTGRLACDPLNQMTFTETSAIAGSGAQTGTNRFGDYAQTTLDPDGITFWHTGEYFSSGQINTRIYSFQLPMGTTGISNENTVFSFTCFQSENVLIVNAAGLPSDKETQVDLFDVEGKLISSQKVIPTDKKIQTQINVSSLSKGVYLVRIGNLNFQRVQKVLVN